MASQRRDDKGIPTSIYVVRRSEPHPLGLPFLQSSLPSDESSSESSASVGVGGDTAANANANTATAAAAAMYDDNSDDDDFGHTHAQARRRLNTNSPTAVLEAAIALQEAESEAAAQLCSAELAEAVKSDNDDTDDTDNHNVEVVDAVTELPADVEEAAEDAPAPATDTNTTTATSNDNDNDHIDHDDNCDDDDEEYYDDDDEEDQFDGESSLNKYLVDDFHFHMHLRRGSTSRVHLKHETAVNVKTCRNDGNANANTACKHYRPYPHLQFVNLCQCQRHKPMHVAAA